MHYRVEPLERRVMLDGAWPVGAEFRVNTYTTLRQDAAAIASDSDGDFVVAWQSAGQDGSDIGIHAQRFGSSGVAQGGEFRVNTFTTGNQLSPAVAIDADGDFVVVWQSILQDGSGYGIYARRYNAAGVAQGSEFQVNTYTTGFQSLPSVAMDSAGDFVVAWQSLGQDGTGSWGIYAQRYNAQGAAQGSEFSVNTQTTNGQQSPAVAMDFAGNFVVTWRSNGQDGSGLGIYAQRYNVAGAAQGAEFQVNTYTTNGQNDPTVAMDSSGDFVVAWSSFGQDGAIYGIYAQRYNAAGVAQGAEFKVNTYTLNQQTEPSAAMDSAGDFVVAWQSAGQEGSDGGGYGIYAQRYNSAGAAQGSEFKVNTYTTSHQLYPTVAMNSSGDFVVAWESPRDGGELNYGIYAQRYTSVPAVTASSFLFDSAPHQLRFTFDENVSASLGTNDLIVQNLTTSQTIPSSDFSLSYDPATNTAMFSYIGGGGGFAGVLPDGNYRATLVAAGITTPNGMPLLADYIFNFSFLNADANRDGRVNLNDFNILAANFGQSPRDFSQGDFNYDGTVNLQDFNVLASRFGSALSAIAAGPQDRSSREEQSPDDEPTSSLLQ